MLRRIKHRNTQSGDTLIEVLFAITVLSLAIVMSLSIMNQGTAASLRSLQTTLVRQEIDSQAEALRFLNSSYVAAYTSGYAPNTADAATSPAEEYYKIIRAIENADLDSVSAFANEGETCDTIPDKSFILNARKARYQQYDVTKFVEAATYSQLVYIEDGTNGIDRTEGLWIEAIRPDTPGSITSYTDFHIRACWGAPGTKVPMTLGTIVRLYDPTN